MNLKFMRGRGGRERGEKLFRLSLRPHGMWMLISSGSMRCMVRKWRTFFGVRDSPDVKGIVGVTGT